MSTVETAVKAPANVRLPIYMDDHATTPMDPRVLESDDALTSPRNSATRPAVTTPLAGKPSRRSKTPGSRWQS